MQSDAKYILKLVRRRWSQVLASKLHKTHINDVVFFLHRDDWLATETLQRTYFKLANMGGRALVKYLDFTFSVIGWNITSDSFDFPFHDQQSIFFSVCTSDCCRQCHLIENGSIEMCCTVSLNNSMSLNLIFNYIYSDYLLLDVPIVFESICASIAINSSTLSHTNWLHGKYYDILISIFRTVFLKTKEK